jgi:hypothetical protein
MLYYLDEQYSDVIAEICRRRGVDTITTHEARRDSFLDDAQLLFAGEQGRAMVTANREDFEYWTEQFRVRGLPHAGVVLVPPSIQGNEYSVIAEGLIYLASLYPDGLPPYTVIWLPRVPEADR